jgi:hypothetical protein
MIQSIPVWRMVVWHEAPVESQHLAPLSPFLSRKCQIARRFSKLTIDADPCGAAVFDFLFATFGKGDVWEVYRGVDFSDLCRGLVCTLSFEYKSARIPNQSRQSLALLPKIFLLSSIPNDAFLHSTPNGERCSNPQRLTDQFFEIAFVSPWATPMVSSILVAFSAKGGEVAKASGFSAPAWSMVALLSSCLRAAHRLIKRG